MEALKNPRTIIAIMLLILLMIVGNIGYLGINYIRQGSVHNSTLYEESVIPLAAIGQAEILYLDQQLELRDMFLTEDRASHEKSMVFINAMDSNIDQDLMKYQRSIQSEEVKNKFLVLKNHLGKDHDTRDRVLKLLEMGETARARSLFQGYQKQVSQNQYAFDELQELTVLQAMNRNDQNTVSVNSHIHLFMLLSVIGLLVVLLIGVILFSSGRERSLGI